MNTRKVDKREQHARKKLTAAILMLLISCIMTVTSTYAWFTLSTAPEVTGIQTTIGGNGNLEIALANYFTWNGMEEPLTLSSSVNDIKATNESWGNLIDVSEDYGMNLLTLAPAKVDGSSSLVTTSTILQVPTYGADGRVSTLAPAMFAGYDVDSKTFKQIADAENDRSTYADNIGLRAIGISTARTARQTAFTAAKSAMTTAVNTAKLGVGDALANNGSALGSLAVKLALDGDTATFDNSELLAIYALVEDTIEGVEYIDDAIIALIDASVASREGQEADIDDLEYELISAMLENAVVYEVSYDGGTKTTNSSFTLSEEGVSPKTVTFTYSNGTGDVSHAIQNDYFYDMIKMYMNVVDDLENALDKLPDTGENSYTWADISESVNILMNMQSDGLKVAGISINTLKENPTNYIDAVLNNTVVELGEGSGVYYNIASLVGTVKASIVLEITYGFNVTRPATISSTNNMPVIPTASLLFELPSADGSEEANQISDIYGFVLDLLFRTNAADSDLLLQTTPVDRIYDNNNNEDTLGNGSTMTFTKTVSTFSDSAMLSLMDSIRIVFMDEAGNVLGTAGLDTGSTTTYEEASTGTTATHAKLTNGTYVKATYVAVTGETETTYRPATDGEIPTHTADGIEAKFVESKSTNYSVNADGSLTVNVRMINVDNAGNKTFITEDSKTTITSVSYVEATADQTATHVAVTENSVTEYYEVKYNETGDAGNTHYLKGENTYIAATPNLVKVEKVTYEDIDPIITSLTQNTIEKVSVLVYLDGETVTNADVANAATSMTATMNLQFSSSAELHPMEYSGLHVTNPEQGN